MKALVAILALTTTSAMAQELPFNQHGKERTNFVENDISTCMSSRRGDARFCACAANFIADKITREEMDALLKTKRGAPNNDDKAAVETFMKKQAAGSRTCQGADQFH